MVNILYFYDPLESIGIGKPSPVDHLWIYVSCPCWRAPLYCIMLILACLTGVTGLVVNNSHRFGGKHFFKPFRSLRSLYAAAAALATTAVSMVTDVRNSVLLGLRFPIIAQSSKGALYFHRGVRLVLISMSVILYIATRGLYIESMIRRRNSRLVYRR